ncbi:hypothetical protein AMTRI_Chr03g49410 [Amborella trichopoda]
MIIPSKALIRLLSSLGFDLNFVHNSTNNQKHQLIFYGHDESMLFSIIHAQTSLLKCMILWEGLKHLSYSYDIPWVIMGDFNAILLSSEKFGEIHLIELLVRSLQIL